MVPGSRVPAQDLSGLGPVGLEQLVLQPFELLGHDGAGDGVEVHGPEPGPAEALDQVDVPAGPAALGVLVGPVGVGQLLPVGGGPGEVGKGELAGLVDQQGLVPGQGRFGLRAPEGDHHVHVGPGDLPVRPGQRHTRAGGGDDGHGATGAGPGPSASGIW